MTAFPIPAQGPTWASPSVRPDARSRHAMAYDSARGRTVLFGGYRAGVGNLADTWEWDGTGWIRCTPPVSPPARSMHVMAFDSARGVTVLFGGIGANYLTDTWEWNGSTWTQVLTANAPPTLEGPTMAYHAGTNPGCILFGGLGAFTYSSGTYRYDGTNWTLVTTSGPSGRRAHAMCFAKLTQCTYVSGGIDTFGAKYDLWAWNGTFWYQTVPAPLAPTWLAYHSMLFDEGRNELVITGGTNGGSPGWGTPETGTHWGLMVPGDPTPNSWTSSTNWNATLSRYVPPPRIYTAAVYDSARSRIVSFGGLEVDNNGNSGPDIHLTYEVLPGPNPFVGDWLERTPVGGSFSNPAPQPRIYTDMAYDQGLGRAVLYGGWSGTAALGDTWSWNGRTWTNHGTDLTAGPRVQPALCWTPWLGTVMFGGASAIGGPFYGDTLAWTGTDWLFTLTAGSPAARYGHDMVLDTARSRVVMFGGYGAGGSLNTTHELVQTSPFSQQWFQITTNGTPPARNSHRLAYDQRRQRTVLFGGSDAAGIFLGDTWEYDGATATWTQRFPAVSPPRRWNHVMEYDPGRGVVVLSGGYGNPLCGNFCASHLNDVWEYDGVTWRQRTTGTTAPSGREGAASAYDVAHQRIVVQGGGASTYPTETWTYAAPVDRQGQAMASNPIALRCTKYPVAGQTTGFSFTSPDGIAALSVMLQPSPSPLVVLGPTLTCDLATVWAAPDILFTAIGSPAVVSVALPGSMAGIGFAAQGLVLDVAGNCFRLSDPIAVTVQAP
ncbi:MAG: hypothetical protein JNL08_12810 [Planctomycetes bacterium]|nr:hypothetical protein [Planctomycetota bacterium]